MFCRNCGAAMESEGICASCGHDNSITTPPPAYPGGANNTTGYAMTSSSGKPRKIDSVLNRPLSGWWQRVGSAVIDGLIIAVAGVALSGVVSNQTTKLLIQGVIQFGYMVLLWTNSRGQTVGNRVVKTQVVHGTDGGRVGIARASIRWAVMSLPGLLLVSSQLNKLIAIQNWQRLNPGASPNDFPDWLRHDLTTVFGIMALVGIYTLLDALWALWEKRSRTIHDLAAGTVVVQMPLN